jgi:hypothetical protein
MVQAQLGTAPEIGVFLTGSSRPNPALRFVEVDLSREAATGSQQAKRAAQQEQRQATVRN